MNINDKHDRKDDIPFLTRLLNEEAENMKIPEMKRRADGSFFFSSSTDNPDEKTMKCKIKKGVNIMNYKAMTTAAAVVVTMITAAGIGLANKEIHDDVTTSDVDVPLIAIESTEAHTSEIQTNPSVTETSVSRQITETSIFEVPRTVPNENTAAGPVYSQPEEIVIDESPEEESQIIADETTMKIADVAGAYKDIINSKINYQYNDTDRALHINYAIYDIDKNGVPELIMIYGLHEASMQFGCFTYNENGVQTIIDGDGGHHSSFGYDVNTGDFVLLSGHMGYGEMIWFNIENGTLTEKNHICVEYADTDEYGTLMKEQGVEYLNGASYDAVLDYTMIYSYDTGEFVCEEYDGADYRFFDTFPNMYQIEN